MQRYVGISRGITDTMDTLQFLIYILYTYFDAIIALKIGNRLAIIKIVKKSSMCLCCLIFSYIYINIIGFLINVQVQGHHPHQWAPFQVTG